jgi:hypothetical protein
MKRSKFIPALAISAILPLFISAHANASNFDGKSNLVCASKIVIGCVYDKACIEGSSSSFDLPNFIVVNFAKKQIHATKESGIEDVSPFKNMETTDSQIIIQGVENHRGWTAAIDRNSGHLSVSSTGSEVSFMIFGNCTGI